MADTITTTTARGSILLTNVSGRYTYNSEGVLRTKDNIWQPPMTLGTLARLSGLRYDHLWMLFNGWRKPNTVTARKLAIALNIDMFELLRRLNI